MVYLHGWPKFKTYLNDRIDFPELLGLGPESGLLLAIFAELLCSVLLAFGFLTRIAVIPLAIVMVVAAFVFNADQGFIVKEKAILYFMVYLCFLIVGAGKYSFDHYLLKKTTSKKQV